MSIRRERFSRSSDAIGIEITSRDRDLLRLVNQHRFLNSAQIFTLLGGSAQSISRRLHVLYHNGYLERPRCQLDFYYKSGSRPMVYGLADKGAMVLSQEGIAVKSNRLSEENRTVGRAYLEHALFVADTLIAIELSCRNSNFRFVAGDEVNGSPAPGWRVKINEQTELGLRPDSAFAIEYHTAKRDSDQAYFFLEADRATMPIVRKDFVQTSFYRKLIAYQATWTQNLHRTLFGFHRFRVLTVTTSAERMQGMIDACSQLENGHGLFLFADRSILGRPLDIISASWRTGKGEAATLLN